MKTVLYIILFLFVAIAAVFCGFHFNGETVRYSICAASMIVGGSAFFILFLLAGGGNNLEL